MTTDSWERVGREARARRKALNLTQAEIAETGGPSAALVRQVETGRYDASMQPSMKHAYERALKWEEGSIDAILAGDSPVEAQPDRRADVVETARTFHLLTPFDRDPRRNRSPLEVTFGEWYQSFRRLLDLEERYAQQRGVPLRAAIDELNELFDVATSRDRPADGWRPPWERESPGEDLPVAAHDEDHAIEDEQGQAEHP